MLYFFILGRSPALSIAEALAVLQKSNLRYALEAAGREVLILDAPEAVEKIFPELGGTIKFGKITGEYREDYDLLSLLPTTSKKLNFGFSFYKLENAHDASLRQLQKDMQIKAMEIKKELRAKSQSSRYVTSRARALSSVIVKTNKLLGPDGAEIIFFVGKNKILAGKTVMVQEFEEYELRDYGRPRRDILRGMLPPKIAKIMINLAGAPRDAAILDPFCGEGTILTEAAILGYKNLIGVDVAPQAIEDTRVNLEWIKKHYRVLPNYNLKIADARTLVKVAGEKSADAIVTEPFLGPLLRGGEKLDTILKIKNELEELYRKVFSEFVKVLKPAGRAVFIFPVWRIGRQMIFIDLGRVLPPQFKIKNLRYMSLRGVSEGERRGNLGDALNDYSSRGGIIWQRPDQRVLREIVVLQKI